jgi:Integrase core domain
MPRFTTLSTTVAISSRLQRNVGSEPRPLRHGVPLPASLPNGSTQLALYVLPPRRPRLNGAVERCNGSWRYEFYAVYDLPNRLDQLQPLVDAFAHRFNHYRPHDALDGKTPAEYLSSLS